MHRWRRLPTEARPRRLTGPGGVVVVLTAAMLGLTAPVTAQDDAQLAAVRIVRITTPATAGVYTVDWQTLGGCDPGEGTSGMAGSVTLTVEADGQADDTPVAGELTGTPTMAIVVTRPICVYTWSVALVEATTDANCIVGPAPFAPDASNRINITLADPETSCAQQSRIIVRLHPAVPLDIDDTDHNAVLRTRFIATARRVEDAPRRCTTRTGVSVVDDNDTTDDTTDDTVSIELRVVATTADGEECRYDVTLRVPRQLAAVHGEHEHNVFQNVDPRATIDFSVGVATTTIYLLQTVVGDSGGAGARYDLSRTCDPPDDFNVPEPLLPRPAGKGITPAKTVTTVELRQGRFNITAVLADDPFAEGAFDGLSLQVLGSEGVSCEATISVSHLPEQCKAEESSLTINLARSPDPAILEFTITCGAEAGDEDSDVDDEDEDNGDSDGSDGSDGSDSDATTTTPPSTPRTGPPG